MYLLIVLLPLLTSLTVLLFGKQIGKEGSIVLTVGGLFTIALFSTIAFYEVALCGNICYITLFKWIDSELLNLSWGFIFDSLTVVMLIVVTYISAFVHLYSTSYMEHDPHLPRFMSYLSLFTFFMLILVTADNFLQMFLGWEGVGLASYLLINFWYTRTQANKSAIKAMIINRIGDFGLALGIFAIFYVFKSIDYATIFSLAPLLIDKNIIFFNFELNALNLICLLLFVGAVGKSAQIGLHTWLPDAMEGPTPVSALIHAATMVTAGVFMIVRCSPLFEYAPNALIVITFMGAMTAFFAATTGIVQNDLKRVIAYSTCSQLGYMVFSCGISNYSVSMFHLANHAFFKALLFLSAGSVIHAMCDEQDMRKLGGLVNILPFTYSMMLIGSLSLVGFPFLTGFYSKDVILELAYAKYSLNGHFAHWLGSLSVLFTSFYSFRLLYLTFINKPNTYRIFLEKAHEASLAMSIPLIALAFGSIFIGYISKDMIIGLGTTFWGNSIFILPSNYLINESEFISSSIKLIPLYFSISGALISYFLIYAFQHLSFNIKKSLIGRKLYTFFNKRWFFDKVQNEFIANYFIKFGYKVSYKTFDRGFIEMFGPFGISNLLKDVIKSVSNFQTGFIFHYAFIMLISVLSLITILRFESVIDLNLDVRLYILYIFIFFFSTKKLLK